MSQFEYTDINKFYISIGVFLIGLTFLLPWLFFRENFDLLIKAEDLKSYTTTAQHIIIQRQIIVSYFPIVILIISSCSFVVGILLCIKGIKGWNKTEKLKQIAAQLSNEMATKEVQEYDSSVSDKQVVNPQTDDIPNSINVPINNLWNLNHWGSDVASIEKGKIIFRGTKTRLETEGCHIDLNDILTIGKIYKISCFARSAPNTTGKFQLWCHDNIGIDPHGSGNTIPYATSSTEGERCSLQFEPKFNGNLRIHLQYMPGEGQIEVSDIKITELKFG